MRRRSICSIWNHINIMHLVFRAKGWKGGREIFDAFLKGILNCFKVGILNEMTLMDFL